MFGKSEEADNSSFGTRRDPPDILARIAPLNLKRLTPRSSLFPPSAPLPKRGKRTTRNEKKVTCLYLIYIGLSIRSRGIQQDLKVNPSGTVLAIAINHKLQSLREKGRSESDLARD